MQPVDLVVHVERRLRLGHLDQPHPERGSSQVVLGMPVPHEAAQAHQRVVDLARAPRSISRSTLASARPLSVAWQPNTSSP